MTTDDVRARAGALCDRYQVPPFSVLDTRQGYWQEARRAWLALGIQSELGRGTDTPAKAAFQVGDQGYFASRGARRPLRVVPADGWLADEAVDTTRRAADTRSNVTGAPDLPGYAAGFHMEKVAPGTSLFDPVLCELAYRWWCPPGGTILDPFAGGSVRGIVAAWLGHPYTGVDLSARQLSANEQQATDILTIGRQPRPRWLAGDSRQVLPTLGPDFADFVFTCPPYYDLEVYSDHPSDLSAMPDWPRFLDAYGAIIGAALDCLRRDRFAAIVVSEIRGPEGVYRGLVPQTIRLFELHGARFYNEAILINPAGTLPMRAAKAFEASRKLGRTHQNILVFVKGQAPATHAWTVERTDRPVPQLTMFGDLPKAA